jgi:hypothetical protein
MMSKKRLIATGLLLLLMAVGVFIVNYWNKTMENKSLYRLNEPMLISSSKGEPYYMIPTNTVLHFQQGFAEGHQLYTIQVFSKGKLPATQISAETPTESSWLYPIDADDVSAILNQYPLSKDDLIRILKARKMTRDELAQIVRDWKDD